MDYTYNYHQMYQQGTQYSELGSRGLSSSDPSQVFLYEILIVYLQELTVYILKLKEFGITLTKNKEDFLDAVSEGIINVEYTEKVFLATITKLYDDIIESKEIYISTCKKNNIEINTPKSKVKDPRKLSFSDIMGQGKKLFNAKYKYLNFEQMVLLELHINILISLFVNLIEARELGFDDEAAYDAWIFIFSWKNTAPAIKQHIPKSIKNLCQINNNLIRKLYEIKKERYGELTPTEVSTSIRSNKVIMVSGSNLRELELLLEITKDKGIDIYTYGNMLYAHEYPCFKTYPHLVGHLGEGLKNYIFDFSEFPGSIFLTKHSFLSVENLYRSRIYTADLIAPPGVGVIKNNAFEPLIQSALRAEGFTEAIENSPIKLNFSEEKFLEKITEIAQKIEEGKIKHFFAIGTSNGTQEQKEYFEKFLNLLGNDCFVLSFSYYNGANNVLHVKSYNTFPILYKTFDILTKNISIEKLNPIILFTKCGEHMLSNLVYMKQIGIKKIYFADCSTNLFNPSLIESTRKLYNIKNYTNPEDDLKDMLA